MPVEEAKRNSVSARPHPPADTGVLDFVFDSYLAHNRREPIAFLDWIDTHYDERAMSKSFKAKSWANLMVNGVMRRE